MVFRSNAKNVLFMNEVKLRLAKSNIKKTFTWGNLATRTWNDFATKTWGELGGESNADNN